MVLTMMKFVLAKLKINGLWKTYLLTALSQERLGWVWQSFRETTHSDGQMAPEFHTLIGIIINPTPTLDLWNVYLWLWVRCVYSPLINLILVAIRHFR